MENNNYNSLAQQLIQNGILQSENSEFENISNDKNNIFENFYGINVDEDMTHSPFIKPVIEEKKEDIVESDFESFETEDKIKEKNRKRINQYDLDMIKNSVEDETVAKAFNFKMAASLKVLNRFLNFKKNKLNKPVPTNFEEMVFRLFPKLYNAKIVKEAISKLLELDIDAKELLDKTIPYGEGENRYEDLIKYLSYANQIQKKLKGKII